MSFDLFERETQSRLGAYPGTREIEPGVFDNFLSGSGMFLMQGLAKTARAVDLLGSVGPIVQDRIAGGTERQDKYFREHEDIFKSAVDYWTPRPNEVGEAAQVVGNLAAMLPTVIASPGLAVGSAQLSAAEDLVLKGASSGKAQAVGAVQGLGLGTGIWMPILGKTLTQRLLVGGAGFNVLQGIGTRGASGAILEGGPGAEELKAFDGTAITLDALLGAAFGGVAHLSKAQRAQGENAWKRIGEWSKGLKPSDVDALATLRQAEHLNSDSLPGRPAEATDIEAHVQAMRQAVDDVLNGRPVDVAPIIREANFLPDDARAKMQASTVEYLNAQAKTLIESGAAGEVLRQQALETPGFLRTAEQLIALKGRSDATLHPEIDRAIATAAKPGFERTQEERILLDAMLGGRAQDYALPALKPEQIHAALKAEGVETTTENVSKVQQIARARALDAKAVDAIPDTIPDGEYMARIKEIVNGKQGTAEADADRAQPRGQAARAGGGEAGQTAPAGEAARGQRGEAQPGGEGAGPDLIAQEAARIALQNPDMQVTVGRNPDGSSISVPMSKLMEDARLLGADVGEARKLTEIAAACLLGGP